MSESESWIIGGILLASAGVIMALPVYCAYGDFQQRKRSALRWQEQCAKEAQEEIDFKAESERIGYVKSLVGIHLEIISRMSNDTEYMSAQHARIVSKIEEELLMFRADVPNQFHARAILSKIPLTCKLVAQKTSAFYRLLKAKSHDDVEVQFRVIDAVNSALERYSS